MKRQKKILVVALIFFSIVFYSCQSFAAGITDRIRIKEHSDKFKQYIKLSDEEKEKVRMPRIIDIKSSKTLTKNLLRKTQLAGSASVSRYSLQDVIPENMVIKNQSQTNSCWTFASTALLESVLALKDYRLAKTPVLYDFSERHMEYATSDKSFTDGINEIGFNREVGTGGYWLYSIPYFTNGTGAVLETALPFEDNEDKIPLSSIKNKEVVTQVNDIVLFPSMTQEDDLTLMKQQMKEHIVNYGAIDVGIHGASILDINSPTCYNNETGAIYCNNASEHPINHEVIIIGWDDNYSVDNFLSTNKPQNPGAWIIKNSWGTELKATLQEAKETVYKIATEKGMNPGWTSPNDVPESFAIQQMEELGFTYNQETQEGILKVGDNGFMYVSYEDVNIYVDSYGITNAQNEIEYDNIYQYNEYGYSDVLAFSAPKAYIANIFDKKTTENEYLTGISLTTLEKNICKVYVNPNGTSMDLNSLKEVELEAGDTEKTEVGYNTIEFAEPIKIKGDKFVVAVEMQGEAEDETLIPIESNWREFYGDEETEEYGMMIYDNVTVAPQKCFITLEDGFEGNEWVATSELDGNLPKCDTTLKAFTITKSLENIEITTPPTKTKYFVGEDFDATGMVVKANYSDGTSEVITDYGITNGTNLMLNQTSVTIVYEEKTVEQPIEVSKNEVIELKITTPPTKTDYYIGDNFDATGMVVEATYSNGSKENITNYEIINGENLALTQKSVTIKYEGVTVEQSIKVIEKVVESVLQGISVKTPPTKTKYFEGEDFDATGMIIEASYSNGETNIVTNYEITNGTNLKSTQTSVKITYEGKSVEQAIQVTKIVVEEIKVKTPPTKTKYYVGEDFDATGMVVEAVYTDQSSKVISDYEIVNGTSLKATQTSVTIKYEEKIAEQAIQVIENAITEIKIATPPTKTEYFAGENFDATGMVVKAIYTNKTEKTITDYTIENGENLLNTQTSVTISYNGKTVEQKIVIKENSLTKLEITKAPNKLNYIVGQNFDPTGMEVKAKYANGSTTNVTKYTIKNGNDLTIGQEYVSIEFEGKSAKQKITVVDKSVASISVKTMPTKTQYFVNEELDLTGGEIEVLYDNDSKSVVKMTEKEVTVAGFDSKTAGTKTIKVTYGNKTTQFNVEVKEKELEKPENSKFDKPASKVNTMKSYCFSDATKQQYIVMNVEVDNIEKATVNEKMEYYYYLSSSPKEKNIAGWVKINEKQNADDNKLKFEINTKDLSNIEEILEADVIYLYIKEVAIRNDMSSEKISNSMELDFTKTVVEEYMDGKKVSENVPGTDSQPGQDDETTTPEVIPNAGKNALTICIFVLVIVMGRIFYKKYKNIQLK